MTTYNTGNPIGSTDARDLYDNAQNLDNFANGTAASYTDRRGVSRRSLSGIDAAADNVLNGIGYAVPVAYASGISLTLTSQTVDYNGVIYAPKSSALPFTTSSWVADSAKFRAIQVTDADLITYTPAGTGAVATNVQSKLREFVSVKDFGAVGDGVTDDRTAIVNALNAAAGRDVVFESGKTYLTSAAIVFNGDVSIRTDGADKAIILHNGQSFDPITVQGTLAVTTTLSLSQQINNRGWTLASIAGIQPGMLMEVISSASWYHDPRPESTDARKSELHRVAYIPNASTVYSEDPANDGYNVSTETVTVKFYTPVSVRMENIAVKCVLPTTGAGAANRTGIIVSYANEPVLLDVDVENAAAVGISLRGCYRPLVQRGHTHSANAFSTGYGVQVYGCAHAVVRDRTFWQCRRGVDVSGANVISRHTLIEACTNMGGGINSEGTVYGWLEDGTTGAPQFGFGSHGPADHTIYRGNRVAQMHTPFSLRGRNEIVEDNYIIGRTRFGVVLLSTGENVWIRRNIVYTGWTKLKDATIYEGGANINTRRADWFVRVLPEYQGGEIVIDGNDVQIQDRFISFDSGAVQTDVTIARNKIRFATSTSSDPVYLAYNEGSSVEVVRWRLTNNDYGRLSGTGAVNRFLNLTYGSTTVMSDVVHSGAWTPTITNVANVASSSIGECQFMRAGDVVTVSGQITLSTSVAATNTRIQISLPIASNFSAGREAAGSFMPTTSNTALIAQGVIYPDAATDTLELRITPPNTTSLIYQFHATYRVIS